MSKRLASTLAAMTRGILRPLPKWTRISILARLSGFLVPRVPVTVAGRTVRLYTPSKSSVYWARHGMEAEPDTLRWIGTLRPGSVFWDIGASVGLYSLAAGLHGLRVLAFEANPFTYECLLRNVGENPGLDSVRPYCLALAESSSLGELFLASNEAGTVGNAFGDPTASSIRDRAGDFCVAAVSASIDDLVGRFSAAFPEHIKIDVDSIEERIILGGRSTLCDPRVRSVLVEIVSDTLEHRARAETIVAMMRDFGFVIDPRVSSASGNRLFVRPEDLFG